MVVKFFATGFIYCLIIFRTIPADPNCEMAGYASGQIIFDFLVMQKAQVIKNYRQL